MNEHNDQLPEELFDLFSSKTFGELTESERELVLTHTTADEYDQFAESVLAFSTLDNSIEINTPEIASLHQKKEEAERWWNYRIPLYQAIAASIVLAVAAVTFLQFSSDTSIVASSNTTTPITLKSIPVDEDAIDRHLAEIKLLVTKEDQPVGISLADDNYPKGLVFDF